MRFLLILFLCVGIAYGQSPSPVLSTADAELYRKIFTVQEDGDWRTADGFIRQLDDDLLMGYVLFQRYMHPTKYRSKYRELRDWLKKYSDHPGATRLYKLARRRKPANYRNPQKPSDTYIPVSLGNPVTDEKPPSRYTRFERNVLRSVRTRVHEGRVTVGRKYIAANVDKLRPFVRAEALAHIARGYFRYNKYKESVQMAEASQKQAPQNVASAEAAWWGGLSAWKLKDYRKAAALFSYVGDYEDSDEWLKSAGHFWAGRAYMELKGTAHASAAWEAAMAAPHSFYGMLAAAELGVAPPIDWETPLPQATNRERVLRIPAVKRVLALVEVGQYGLAESTMKPIIKRLKKPAAEALLHMANELDLAYSIRSIAEHLENLGSEKLYSALYPQPNWLTDILDNTPHDEHPVIDRAVILGFALQESKFRQHAKSSAGARGIMQLMPATASFIGGKRIPRSRRDILFDTQLNITLGRKYIAHLLRNDRINNNLLFAVISYNSGSGNLSKWRRQLRVGNDPLLFIESLPWRESRIYVERVIANIWVYRMRLQQDTPSLTALSQGRWPTYISQEKWQ